VGAYSLFIDLSLGMTGPLVGAVAAGFGFASMFLFAAGAAACGLVLSLYLYRQARRMRRRCNPEQSRRGNRPQGCAARRAIVGAGLPGLQAAPLT
jgi:predicted lipid-binding transport protein (Tim44 family)